MKYLTITYLTHLAFGLAAVLTVALGWVLHDTAVIEQQSYKGVLVIVIVVLLIGLVILGYCGFIAQVRALDIAKVAAEEASTANSVVFSAMSHEIRTPMNAIAGLSHLALKTGLTPRQRGYLKKIQDSGQDLMRIINDILDFSNSEKNAGMMHGEISVDSQRSSGIDMNRQLILRADLHGRRMLVVDDDETSREVIGDLLKGMGFHFNEAASGVEAIEAVCRSDALDSPYEIVFLDWQMPDMDGLRTARQIRAQALKNVPHMIMVTAYGREDVINGVEEAELDDVLIKPLSASVLFDSVARVLGGTPDVPRVTGDAPSLMEEKLDSIKGARILLVEDNDINQEMVLELLRDAGFIVDLAENGEIALHKIQEVAYNMVLMDMQMPVMDGIIATLEIRKLQRFAEMPIVAMTANALAEDRQRCLEAGMNDHIAKPIEPDDLWRALLKWVKARPADSEKRERIAADMDRLRAVCVKLEKLLADADSEAGNVLDENADLLNAAFPNHYRKINDDIKAFNFTRALATLKACQ